MSKFLHADNNDANPNHKAKGIAISRVISENSRAKNYSHNKYFSMTLTLKSFQPATT